MRIMVFDVPAEAGGALTILKQYYAKAEADKKNEWIFVVSKPELKQTERIAVLRYPVVKKSWAHRLWFDRITAKKIVKKYKPDKIISLQNTIVNAQGYVQELYVHQSLPFAEKRFSFRENKKLWIYQNIIGRMIIRSVKKADKVIVQTKWIKEALLKRTGIEENRITVEMPEIKTDGIKKYERNGECCFFYPAGSASYKNHKIIYEAATKLRKMNCTAFKIILTIDKPEADCSAFEQNIEFCGYMSREKVNDCYGISALLFPSYIESLGLPLLEAREAGCPIIASDCAFSREILEGYDKAVFFDPFSADELAEEMKKYIESF